MREIHYLIIGGGIAGTTAAETIRRIDRTRPVAIISKESYPLYSRIALSKPNFFLEKMPADSIWLKTKEWYEKEGIALVIGAATAVNTKKKTLTLQTGEVFSFQKLLLATGAVPKQWSLAGSTLPGVFRMQTIDDAAGIIETAKRSTSAAIVGGGFIAFEMCDMLRLRGLTVTLIMRDERFWTPTLDETAGRIIEKAMEKAGIIILREKEVREITGDSTVRGITLISGEKIQADLVITGIGVAPDIKWLASSGISFKKGIVTNEYLETSAPDIWAAGDSAEFLDVYAGRPLVQGNWVNAQMQGMAAGKSMAGERTEFRMVSSYATTGFGVSLVFAGDIKGDEGREILRRGSYESDSYAEIIIENEKIAGAILINKTAELAPLSALIRAQRPITDHRDDLRNPNFELKKLIVSNP